MEKNCEPNRRGFFHKLVGLAALGSLSSLILSHKVERVKALDGSGAADQIAYWSDADTVTGSSRLKWDDANNNFAAGWATVTSGVQNATISGGGASGITNRVTDNYGTVGGGYNNQAGDGAGTTIDKRYATVGGGISNTASGAYSTVGGGVSNTASGEDSTASGGYGNTASGTDSTVGGGSSNDASNNYATVGGGYDNTASGLYSTVAGGLSNNASGPDSTVAGGSSNLASGGRSTVSGGVSNTASGIRSTVSGGDSNTAAGDWSLAAGRRVKIAAEHDGAFLFADQNDFDFNSAVANEFAIRCTGGARFVTTIDGSGNPLNGIYMTAPAKLGVGISSPFAHMHIKGSDIALRLLIAQSASGQTASLQEWQNSDGIPLSVIDKDGFLGVGTNSPAIPIHVKSSSSNPAVRLENEGNHVGQFIYCYSSNGHIPFFSGRRARGTIASPSAVQADDTLMRYGGAGYGSTTFPPGNRAILEFKAAQNWTDAAQGTYITFSTTLNNSNSATERMRITDAGEIVPPTDNTGSIGTASRRWNLVRATTVTSGDLAFENSFTVTEDENVGLAFKNDAGEKIAILDREGNLRVKGKVIEGF